MESLATEQTQRNLFGDVEAMPNPTALDEAKRLMWVADQLYLSLQGTDPIPPSWARQEAGKALVYVTEQLQTLCLDLDVRAGLVAWTQEAAR